MALENIVTELSGRNVLTGSEWGYYNDSNLPSLSLCPSCSRVTPGWSPDRSLLISNNEMLRQAEGMRGWYSLLTILTVPRIAFAKKSSHKCERGVSRQVAD